MANNKRKRKLLSGLMGIMQSASQAAVEAGGAASGQPAPGGKLKRGSCGVCPKTGRPLPAR
jgi:hypothetical protein